MLLLLLLHSQGCNPIKAQQWAVRQPAHNRKGELLPTDPPH